MARGYQFINRATGQPDSLNLVDQLMCEHIGADCDSSQYCELYHLALHYGFAYLMRNGGGHVPLDRDFSIVPSWDDDLDEERKAWIEWAHDVWEFHGWG